MRRAVAAVAVATVLVVVAPSAATAATSRTVVQGSVLRLESIQDRDAMAAMAPGEPVAWDVGVSASRPDGRIVVALDVDASGPGFSAIVSACDEAWSADGCAPGASELAAIDLVDGVVELDAFSSERERWYRVEVMLDADPVADADADAAPVADASVTATSQVSLVLRASGLGDEVASGGGTAGEPGGSGASGPVGGATSASSPAAAAALARTGGDVAGPWIGLAALALVLGAVLVGRGSTSHRSAR